MLVPWKKSYDKPRQCIKKQRHYFANKRPYSQSYGFSSSHVWMWEMDHKESWALKNWCFWTVVLEKTLESPLDCKEIKPVNPEGNQSWIITGRTDAEAEAPIPWPPDVKTSLLHLAWHPCRTAFISTSSVSPPYSCSPLSYSNLPINLKPSSLFSNMGLLR